jgi:hypothetical protein
MTISSKLGLGGPGLDVTGGLLFGTYLSQGIGGAAPNWCLFDQPMPVGVGRPFADYHEASFAGYARIAWGLTPFSLWPVGVQPQLGMLSPGNAVWTVGAIVGPAVVFGVGIVDSSQGGDVLIAAMPLSTPLPLTTLGQVLTLHNPAFGHLFAAFAASMTRS